VQRASLADPLAGSKSRSAAHPRRPLWREEVVQTLQLLKWIFSARIRPVVFKSLPIGPTAAASARAISVPISVQG
jgi:hypothetical protein